MQRYISLCTYNQFNILSTVVASYTAALEVISKQLTVSVQLITYTDLKKCPVTCSGQRKLDGSLIEGF